MGRRNCNRCSKKVKNIIFNIMEKYKCSVCGFVYDPAEGDNASDIGPGVAFTDLPDGYVCPVCGAGKDEFFVVD